MIKDLTQVGSARFCLALVFLLLLCAAVFWPGLSGGFMFDDRPNLVLNEQLQIAQGWHWQAIWDATWSSNAGPLKRPVSMFSFALNHAATGMNPWPMKLSNLLIHMLTGVGFYVYGRYLVRAWALKQHVRTASFNASAIALLAMGLWLLHPLQITSVLYVVQRMASLCTLFMAWGLAMYAWGRSHQLHATGEQAPVTVCLNWLMIASAWLVFLPLAAFSKENGVLLCPLLLLTEWLVFKGRGLGSRGRWLLGGVHVVTCILPAVALSVFLLTYPQWILAGYQIRDFDLAERLMTQARALWFYLRLLLIPDISLMGLYHDDFAISRSLWQPWTTVPALLALLALALAAFLMRKRWPVFAFAVFFFLTGHVMESSALALEIMHEHRNYLPSFGLTLALACGFAGLWERWIVHRRLLALLGVAVVLCLPALTAWRAVEWGDDIHRTLMEAEHHPRSPRALTDAAMLLGQMGVNAEQPEEKQRLMRASLQYHVQANTISPTPQSRVGQIVALHHLGESVSAQEVQALKEMLATPPLAYATPEVVISILQCQHAGHCRFKLDFLFDVANALLENPQIWPIAKARVNTMLGQLLIDQGEPRQAVAFMWEAYDANPQSPQTTLNLVDVLIDLGVTTQARDLLLKLESQPLDMLYQQRAARLKAQLPP